MRALLWRAFETAIAAAHPDRFVAASALVARLRDEPPRGRTVVVGAGKAAASMARALEECWPLSAAPKGLVVTRDGYGVRTQYIEVIEAAHPNPDARCITAAERIAALVTDLAVDDRVIVLLSGGASSLLSWPVPGVELGEYAALLKGLMNAGADIRALNSVRKHLSRLAGGGLAKLCAPAEVDALILSDVTGDDPTVIASGPVSPDPTTLAVARGVLDCAELNASPAIAAALTDACNETVKPFDPVLAHVCCEVVLSDCWVDPVCAFLSTNGYRVRELGRNLEGEATDLARRHAAIALAAVLPGVCTVFVSGGETTVTVRQEGKGGPNHEYALALALALNGSPHVSALACDSDGSDGATDAAGAIITPLTLARATLLSIDPTHLLSINASGEFFDTLGDAVLTGPTYTNVNDIRILLVR